MKRFEKEGVSKIRLSWLDTIRWRLLFMMLASLALTGAALFLGYTLAGALQSNDFLAIPINWSIEHVGSLRMMILTGILLLPAALFLTSRRLVKELHQINTGLQEIKAGQFGRVVYVSGKNELSAVAESMNELNHEWNHYLTEITRGLEEIAKGQFDHQIPEIGGNKLGEVVHSINQMRMQLKQSITEERRAEKTKNDLITGVSHDLRTPLTSILGFLEVIEEDRYQDEVEMRYYVNIAYEKSLALRRLIDELFEYTRINNGMPLDLQELDLAGLIRQLAEEFVPTAGNEGMEIRLTIPEGEFKIQADGFLLVRAYENLIMNAIRYGQKGKYIDIALVRDGDGLIVRIQNYGDLIPEQDLPFIFDRFYRGERSRSKQTGGTGLGLAITKSIIEVHGGSITARSSMKATSFETRLPLDSLVAANAEGQSWGSGEAVPPGISEENGQEIRQVQGTHRGRSTEQGTPPQQRRAYHSRLIPIAMIVLLLGAAVLFGSNNSITSGITDKLYSIVNTGDSVQMQDIDFDRIGEISSSTDKGYTLTIHNVFFDGYRLVLNYSVSASEGTPHFKWLKPDFQLDPSSLEDFPGISLSDSGPVQLDAKNGSVFYTFNGTSHPSKLILKVNVPAMLLIDDSAQEQIFAGDWSFEIPVKQTHRLKPNGQSEPLDSRG